MWLIPFEQFEIKTSLKSGKVRKKLEGVIEPRDYARRSREHTFFEGTLEQKSFNIRRILHYRNSFLPVILGTIQEKSDYTSIHVRMRLHGVVITFLVIWLFIVVTTLSGFVFNPAIFEDRRLSVMLFFIPLTYVISIFFFQREARKARRYLEELFGDKKEAGSKK